MISPYAPTLASPRRYRSLSCFTFTLAGLFVVFICRKLWYPGRKGCARCDLTIVGLLQVVPKLTDVGLCRAIAFHQIVPAGSAAIFPGIVTGACGIYIII